MIHSVRGPVLEIGLDHAVIEVGGVGLAVYATPATLGGLRRGDEARLPTHAGGARGLPDLYGFADAEERELFLLLQTVSGIGTRLALATIAVLEPDTLRRALADGDLAVLTRIPGVGRKSAERLVVELRDKVTAPAPRCPRAPSRPHRPRCSGCVTRSSRRCSGSASPSARPSRRRRGPGPRPRHRRPGPAAHRAVEPGQVAVTDPDPYAGVDGRLDERAVDAGVQPGDTDVEASLRPRCWPSSSASPGSASSCSWCWRARRRGDPPDHILLSGPPRARQDQPRHDHRPGDGAAIRLTSGPALERAGDLAAMLSNLVPGDVLFIDEIHRTARPAEEMLYLA
ncbi:Holliday junction branch migration protein RuvA, partial [Pseudonocardia sp. ICBG601]|uniref:Holliday junction branch migration protein RuvA n=1 Tax=Pseudonocardia sp. ICBG601 TaxID=2846759 RepID=UPI0035AB9BE7